MLIDFIFLLILFVLLYSYTSYQNQFAATASAIRDIWSGSCGLSCRHSERSELSGLSGLAPHTQSYGLTQATTARSSLAGPSRECNCESCPCQLIENFLRRCRPATTMYALMIESTSNCVINLLQMLEDAYSYVQRVFECNTACQRNAQVVGEKEYSDSIENLSFGKADKQIIEKLRRSIEGKSDIIKQQYSKKTDDDAIATSKGSKSTRQEKETKRDGKETNHQEGTSKAQELKIKDESSLQDNGNKIPTTSNIPLGSQTIPESSNDSVLAEKGYCSKCIKKGRTCIKECPRAKSNKK